MKTLILQNDGCVGSTLNKTLSGCSAGGYHSSEQGAVISFRIDQDIGGVSND